MELNSPDVSKPWPCESYTEVIFRESLGWGLRVWCGHWDLDSVLPVEKTNLWRGFNINSSGRCFNLRVRLETIALIGKHMVRPKCLLPEMSLRSFTRKGLNPDAFVVAVWFGNDYYHFTSSRETHKKRSEAYLPRTCPHNPNRSVTLPASTATDTALHGPQVDPNLPQVCIWLVRGSPGGRWLTILSGYKERKVALTMGHVCLECAVQQVLKLGRKWFIVC